jgi:hypothetical protein
VTTVPCSLPVDCPHCGAETVIVERTWSWPGAGEVPRLLHADLGCGHVVRPATHRLRLQRGCRPRFVPVEESL